MWVIIKPKALTFHQNLINYFLNFFFVFTLADICILEVYLSLSIIFCRNPVSIRGTTVLLMLISDQSQPVQDLSDTCPRFRDCLPRTTILYFLPLSLAMPKTELQKQAHNTWLAKPGWVSESNCCVCIHTLFFSLFIVCEWEREKDRQRKARWAFQRQTHGSSLTCKYTLELERSEQSIPNSFHYRL